MCSQHSRESTIILPYGAYVEHRRSEDEFTYISRSSNTIVHGPLDRTTETHNNFNEHTGWTICPYCSSRLVSVKGFRKDFKEGYSWSRYTGSGSECNNCMWWQYHTHDCSSSYRTHQVWTTYQAIIYEFNVMELQRHIVDVRLEIAKETIDFTNLSPRDLELVVGSVLSDHLNRKVRHVGGPGDRGIDLLVVEDEQPIIVQVKRPMDTDKKVDVSVVRELVGTIVLEGMNKGLVVTTARDFTAPAMEAAARAKTRGIEIDLYNQHRLRELLNLTEPREKPWLEFIPKDLA